MLLLLLLLLLLVVAADDDAGDADPHLQARFFRGRVRSL